MGESIGESGKSKNEEVYLCMYVYVCVWIHVCMCVWVYAGESIGESGKSKVEKMRKAIERVC